MKTSKLLAGFMAVLMLLAVAPVNAISLTKSEIASEQVTTEGAEWIHGQAGETISLNNGSEIYCDDETWVMQTTDDSDGMDNLFEGMIPTEVSTFYGKDGEKYTAAFYSQGDIVKMLNSTVGNHTKPDEKLVSKYGIDENGMIKVMITLDSKPIVDDGECLVGTGLTKAQSDKQQELLKEHKAVVNKLLKVLSSIEVCDDFTILLNGFSAKVPFNEIKRIDKIQGVAEINYIPAFEQPYVVYDEPTEKENTKMLYGNNVIESNAAWERGLNGEGMVVAILDTGLDTDNLNFAESITGAKYTAEKLQALMDAHPELSIFKNKADLKASDLYINEKIPYAYDYADKDTNVNHGGKASSHGTHVAGIVAGQANQYSIDHFGLTSLGVAPQAQIIPMKVFSNKDGAANFDNIISALEDAIILGVDSINLSFGAVSGPTYYEGYTEVFDKAYAAGINIVASAGNSASSTFESVWNNDLGITDNPDVGLIGMPATFKSVLAVASYNNEKTLNFNKLNSFWYTDNDYGEYGEDWRITYEDKAPYNYKINVTYADQTLPIYISEKVVSETDLTQAAGKILIADYVDEKVDDLAAAAKTAGVKALVLYSSAKKSSFVDTTRTDWTYPVVALKHSSVFGYVVPNRTVEFKIPNGWETKKDEKSNDMSSFSSWGTTPDLNIKPEVTAVGGGVLSCYNGNNGYALGSGTSMAAPMVAGSIALLRQYFKAAYGLTGTALNDVVNNVLMSSATPVLNDEGLTYSPRYQGAGLMNMRCALDAGAYITTELDRAKIELGDDPEKTGEYTLKFKVVNMTEADKTYAVSANVLTESAETGRINSDKTSVYLMTQKPYELNAQVTAPNTITVPANSTKDVVVKVKLSESDIKYIEKYFANGIYVEGFVTLTNADDNGIDLSVPYLGFYGDWLAAPALEQNYCYDYSEIERGETTETFTINGAYTYDSIRDMYVGLGECTLYPNNSELPATQLGTMRYVNVRNAISPNGDGMKDAIDKLIVSLNRNADNFKYEVVDANTGEVYYTKDLGVMAKTYFVTTQGKPMPVGSYKEDVFDFDYKDKDGNVLANNTQLIVKCIATMEYNSRTKTETWEFPLTIDLQSPITSIQMTYGSAEIEEWSDEEDDFVGTGEYDYFAGIAAFITENQFMDAMRVQAKNKMTVSTQTSFSTAITPGTVVDQKAKIYFGGLDSENQVSRSIYATDYAGNGGLIVVDKEMIDTYLTETAKLDKTEIYMHVGDTADVTATMKWPDFDAYNNKWSLDSTTVADVEKKSDVLATITAKEVGDTTLTLQTGFRSFHTCIVHVIPDTVTINATANEGGKIDPAGEMTYATLSDETPLYTITPDEGYHIVDVLVDDISVGAVETYTFTGLTQNHTINAVFAPDGSEDGYNVYFMDWDGTMLKHEVVAYGADATAPEDPTRGPGYAFTGWSGEYTNVKADVVLVAQYKITVTIGDANLDNTVNTGDAVLILKGVVGMVEFNELQRVVSDVNYDIVVNTGDVVSILRYCVGIIDSFKRPADK